MDAAITSIAFTTFVLLRVVLDTVLRLIHKRFNITIQSKEYAGLIVDLLMCLFTVGMSMFYVVVAWKEVITGIEHYILFANIAIAHCLLHIVSSEVDIITFYRTVTLTSYIIVIREPKLAWYMAMTDINTLTFLAYFTCKLLEYYGKEKLVLYVKIVKCVMWLVFRPTTIAISIYRTTVTSFPSVAKNDLVSGSICIASIFLYGLYIMLVDVIYCITAIRKRVTS